MELIKFILISWGFSNILAKMKISKSLRLREDGSYRTNPISQMLMCPACNGFWIGVLLYLSGMNTINYSSLLDWLYSGFLSSGTCWIIFSLLDATGVYEKH